SETTQLPPLAVNGVFGQAQRKQRYRSHSHLPTSVEQYGHSRDDRRGARRRCHVERSRDISRCFSGHQPRLTEIVRDSSTSVGMTGKGCAASVAESVKICVNLWPRYAR